MNSEVLGFFGHTNKWTHDHSAALSSNGGITEYVQLERITRKKYDNRIPDYLPQIIKSWNRDISDLDLVYVNTFSLDDRFFKISENNVFSDLSGVEFKHPGYENLKTSSVNGKVGDLSKDALIVPHEIAHIFSCIPFYGMFQDNSLLIHIDGAASISNASAWIYKQGKLELLEVSSEFHHALLTFSYNDLSLKVLGISKDRAISMPGKLMGFSSYGNYNKEMANWLKQNKFFYRFNETTEQDLIQYANTSLSYSITKITQRNQFSYDYAATLQRYFEDTLLRFIEKHRSATGATNLYFSGGAALNIKLNARLAESGKFNQVFVPPPAGDSGLSLGALAYYNWMNNHSTGKMSVFMNNYGLKDWKFEPEFSVDEICKLLHQGNVIGISTGFGEIGPRALGHRSILAIPTKENYVKVSMEIKKREWYRPIAPVLLEKNLELIFDNPVSTPFMYFMLQEMKVRDEVKDRIAGIVHVDGTSRPQVISNEKDGELQLIQMILETMMEEYDTPCLINTSFNSAGEPIVHTPIDAVISARQMGLDYLVINNELSQIRKESK